MVKRDDSDKAFQTFLDRHPKADRGELAPAPRDHDDPIVHELVTACLAWDAPRKGVAPALEKIRETLIDYNEFRVMIPEDAGALLGARYPNAEERCARIRAALTEVFHRENGVALSHLREANKRDAKAYLDSLPGLPAYVVNRVALVGCGVHAFPVDSVIHDLFDNAGVTEADSNPSALASRLERTIRAGDAEERFWAIEAATTKAASKKPASKATSKPAKKTTKKAAAKPTSKAASKTTKKTAKTTATKPAKKTATKSKKTSQRSSGKDG